MSMKNSSDTIGNQSSDLSVCSAVHQTLRHQQRAPQDGSKMEENTGDCERDLTCVTPLKILEINTKFCVKITEKGQLENR
jgi:hypothetical protein